MQLFSGRAWGLRRRVTALCGGTAAVLLALGIFAAVTATVSNDRLNVVLNRTNPMRAAGEDLLTAMLDQETGIRGFALSGDEANLAPYNRGLTDQQNAVIRIEGLLRPSDTPIRLALEDVRARIDTWHTAIAFPLLQTVRTQDLAAGQRAVNAATTTQFDALRAAIAVMQRRVDALRIDAAAAARQASRTMASPLAPMLRVSPAPPYRP